MQDKEKLMKTPLGYLAVVLTARMDSLGIDHKHFNVVMDNVIDHIDTILKKYETSKDNN